jgi:hypothetical protein
MAEIDELKRMADPYTKLVEIARSARNEQVITNNLLGDMCDSNDAVVEATNAVLEVKVRHHNDWMKATARRFWVSFVTLMVMSIAFYVDVVLEGRGSPFANSIADFIGLSGALL